MSFNPQRYSAPDRVDLPDRTWPERALTAPPIWCSVDLRDGNQALVEPMGLERKQQLLALLLKVGFEQIELGFPSASKTEFDFVRWVIEQRALPRNVTPQVITPARAPLIERTFEAIAGAERVIVHLYNSTSELQRRVVFEKSRREILELAVRGTELVREHAARLSGTEIIYQYSPESFTGTELDYALEVIDAVVEAWGPTPERKMIVNLPSTVEVTTPNVFADRIEWLGRRIARRDSIVLGVHPHNDRGTGVATAELALLAGAERVEGTLLGNGERSGNVDLVTLALNLYSHGVDPGLVLDDLPALVRIVEHATRLPVHPRHPYAGELVFTAFSGSHQDAIHKGMKKLGAGRGTRWEVPYLPIDPADLGRTYERVIRINSQSGKGGVAHVLERDRGYRVPRALAIELSERVQLVTDERGEELAPEAIVDLFERTYLHPAGPLRLETCAVERRAGGAECAIAARMLWQGEALEVRGVGAGPVAAFVHALTTLPARAAHPGEVLDYSEHAVGTGADAHAVAYVALAPEGDPARARYGVGRDRDVVLASLRAIVAAINRAFTRGVAAAEVA
jgi:2-isopropylmalate synthase